MGWVLAEIFWFVMMVSDFFTDDKVLQSIRMGVDIIMVHVCIALAYLSELCKKHGI